MLMLICNGSVDQMLLLKQIEGIDTRLRGYQIYPFYGKHALVGIFCMGFAINRNKVVPFSLSNFAVTHVVSGMAVVLCVVEKLFA